MKKQLWNKYTESAYQTSSWSGGTTTQLAIEPEGAAYGDRDFLWRLSSARVDLPHSVFTALPDYDRIIAPLEGSLVMKCGESPCFSLAPLELCAFDGAAETESWGKCRDFNLMLRKGKCRGAVQALRLLSGATLQWTPPVLSGSLQAHSVNLLQKQAAIYCVSGSVTLACGGEVLEAAAGELLFCKMFEAWRAAESGQAPVGEASVETAPFPEEGVQLSSGQGAVLMAALVEVS